MLYGAYGANLNMSNMEVRCPLAKPILGFHLVDYKLVFNGVADIIKHKGAKVPIGLWKITDKCEKALDKFEGFPYLYKKIYVKDLDIPGARGKCMLYVMRRKGYGVPPLLLQLSAQGYEDLAWIKTICVGLSVGRRV